MGYQDTEITIVVTDRMKLLRCGAMAAHAKKFDRRRIRWRKGRQNKGSFLS